MGSKKHRFYQALYQCIVHNKRRWPHALDGVCGSLMLLIRDVASQEQIKIKQERFVFERTSQFDMCPGVFPTGEELDLFVSVCEAKVPR